MTIDANTVDHVAELCKLGLDPAERADLQHQLERILGFVDQIAAIDPEDLGRASGETGPGAATLRLRPDRVTASLPREAVLDNAPEVEAGFFRVPPIQPDEEPPA